MKKLLILFLAIIICSCKKSNKPSETTSNVPVELKTTVLTSGLSNPWELIYTANDQVLFTEKSGKISSLNPLTKAITTIFTISDVVSKGEGGLLGMVLHPDYPSNPIVFVVYNYNSNNVYKEKIVSYTFNNNTFSNPKILLENIPANTFHNGSRLMISNDYKLFVTTGDAGNTSSAQDFNSLSGKILRMNLDGSIPNDNPIQGSYIYSYGHRNPQGLIMVGDKIFSSEHGPNNDDEINLIKKGKNYGWPNVEGFCDKSNETAFCNQNFIVEPLFVWTPTVATAGLVYYNSNLIPQWKNSLLLATLKASKIIQLKLNESKTGIDATEDFFSNEFGRKRAICIGKGGEVYFSTSNGTDDKIIMISTKN